MAPNPNRLRFTGGEAVPEWNEVAHFMYGPEFWYADPLREINGLTEEQLFWKFGKEFAKGTVLFREGDLGRDMFVIQKGKVQVKKRVGTMEKILAELSDGDFFGEKIS
jgi:hypothetical protein